MSYYRDSMHAQEGQDMNRQNSLVYFVVLFTGNVGTDRSQAYASP